MRIVTTAGLMALAAILVDAEPRAESIQTKDLLDRMQDSFRNVADTVFSSLVHIEAGHGGSLLTSGSGFIVDSFPDRDSATDTFYVATNHHVAGGAYDHIQVTTRDGRTFKAELLGSDPRYDVALLSFEHSTDDFFFWSPSVSSIGDSETVQAGDLVFAVGSPQGLPETVTLGIVSHVSRESPDSVGVFIQTDTAINPGNSGGPLVSLRDGTVVGVNTWIKPPQIVSGGGQVTTEEGDTLFAFGSVGLGFAVPINVAMRIVQNLRDHGTPRHGFIGVEYSPLGATDVVARCGPPDLEGQEWDDETWAMFVGRLTTIMNVAPLAPADQHGLKPGDVIDHVDGEFAPVIASIDRPASHSKLVRMIDALTPGENSTFRVVRDCEFLEITLQAGVRVEEEAGGRLLARWPGMLLDAALTVVAVHEPGVAASLGIKEGDIVTEVNGEQIENLGQFYLTIDQCRTQRCSLGVYRSGVQFWTPEFLVPRKSANQEANESTGTE